MRPEAESRRAAATQRRRARAAGRRDAGTSTVVAVGGCALAAAAILALGMLGRGVVLVARADSAADLAALAAASALVSGRDDPCAEAEAVAERNGAEVSECIARADLGTVAVTVSVPIDPPIPGVHADEAVSRAVAGAADHSGAP